MQAAAETSRRLLQTASSRAADDWDNVLRHQVDFSFPQELGFLLALTAWRQATRVLDVGCGNGYYLSRLKAFFPDKQYAGLDASPELIARAESRCPAISFSVADFMSYTSPARFDMIIMRFLVQHMKDFGSLMRAADRLLAGSGRLIIIETDLARSSHYPALPIFTNMLLTYANVSMAHGAVKQALLDDAAQLLATAPVWSIEQEAFLACPQIGPFVGSKLLAIYRLWVDLCERSKIFPFDFGGVRRELQDWAAHDASFSSVALRILVLKKLRQAPN